MLIWKVGSIKMRKKENARYERLGVKEKKKKNTKKQAGKKRTGKYLEENS